MEKCMQNNSIARITKDGVEVDLIVSPGVGMSKIDGVDMWRNRLVVKVASAPEKGRANEELVTMLSKFFQCNVEITKGHKSRMKTVLLKSDLDGVKSKLKGLDDRSGRAP